jgi:hypothetical protein
MWRVGDEILIGAVNADSDDSTDDDRDVFFLPVEAICSLVPKECPWVRLVYKCLMRTLKGSNFFVCVREFENSKTWKCWKRFTVRRFLALGPNDLMFTGTGRSDVKQFLHIQAGEFLHRVQPGDTYFQWVVADH